VPTGRVASKSHSRCLILMAVRRKTAYCGGIWPMNSRFLVISVQTQKKTQTGVREDSEFISLSPHAQDLLRLSRYSGTYKPTRSLPGILQTLSCRIHAAPVHIFEPAVLYLPSRRRSAAMHFRVLLLARMPICASLLRFRWKY